MSEIFTPYKLGPIELRNRTIRSAAFEGMGKNNAPTEELFNYHRAVARGGIGMTTVAYAAVCQSGISFDSQLWMREEIVPELKRLTDAVHAEGAKASIQLGHCGNMTHRRTCGQTPMGAVNGFNLYSPTFYRKMKQEDIDFVVKSYGDAVRLAMKAGFDAVEIHAGHGYLISQFLSPYTNHRHDRYGGSLDNRMNFMRECIREVVKAADGKIAVTAKLNTRDGFKGGQEVDELIEVVHKQQADFALKLQAEQGKTALESAKAEVLNSENEKLKAELETAKNNTENETRMQQMQNEIENKAAKISNLQNEVQNLNNALTNRKTQLEEFEAKNKELQEQLEEANGRVLTLEQTSSAGNSELEELKEQLAAETLQKEDLAQKCQDFETKLAEMQTTISQTSENIDDVVARLEKVLEENGASYNNN